MDGGKVQKYNVKPDNTIIISCIKELYILLLYPCVGSGRHQGGRILVQVTDFINPPRLSTHLVTLEDTIHSLGKSWSNGRMRSLEGHNKNNTVLLSINHKLKIL